MRSNQEWYQTLKEGIVNGATQSLKLENETVTNNRAEQPTWWPFQCHKKKRGPTPPYLFLISVIPFIYIH